MLVAGSTMAVPVSVYLALGFGWATEMQCMLMLIVIPFSTMLL